MLNIDASVGYHPRRCDARGAAAPGGYDAGGVAWGEDRRRAARPGGVSPDCFDGVVRHQSHDVDLVGASRQPAGGPGAPRAVSTWAAVAIDPADPASSRCASRAFAGRIRMDAGAVGWPDAGPASAQVLWRAHQGPAGAKLVAPSRLSAQTRGLPLCPSPSRGRAPVPGEPKKRLAALKPRETIVFEDETGFTLHPRLGRGWAKRGQRLRVATRSAHRERLNIFGWVAPLLGRRGMLRHPQGNH